MNAVLISRVVFRDVFSLFVSFFVSFYSCRFFRVVFCFSFVRVVIRFD